MSRFLPVLCIGLAGVLIAIDWVTGPNVELAITYIFPVAGAAWYAGARWGYVLALALTFARLLLGLSWHEPGGPSISLLNFGIELLGLTVIVAIAARASQALRLKRQVRALSGLLPICAFCKRIRIAEGRWQQIESYVASHSEADFTHTYCPDCTTKHYGPATRQDRRATDRAIPPDAQPGAD
jgi:hypothetical protein